jgi:hypothetical protein
MLLIGKGISYKYCLLYGGLSTEQVRMGLLAAVWSTACLKSGLSAELKSTAYHAVGKVLR